MLRIIQTIITLLIVASLILQILVLLGNFSGLRNVNILRIELSNPQGSSGLLAGLFDTVKNTIDNSIPDYLTLGLFVICEGSNSNSSSGPTCSPSSFGFRYTSTGVLNTISNELPSSIHSTLAAVQEGVFIPSAVFCFILLCYNFYHQYTGQRAKHQYGCYRIFLILTIAVISLLFCIATFVIQIVAYNLIKNEINKAKSSIFGGLFSNIVDITTKTGSSVWLSLAAFISLFIVCVLLLFSACCFDSNRKRRRTEENYEMGPVA